MPAACSEPSLVMTLVGLRNQVIRYELALIRFCHALAHRGPLVVRHSIDAGSPRFDFASVFGEFFLVFAGPGFGVGQQVAERLCHHWLSTTFIWIGCSYTDFQCNGAIQSI